MATVDLLYHSAADFGFEVEEVFVSSCGVLVMRESGDTQNAKSLWSCIFDLDQERVVVKDERKWWIEGAHKNQSLSSQPFL